MLRYFLTPALAISLALTASAQAPGAAVSLYSKGKKLIENGMFYEAVQCFKKATVLYRNYDSAYLEWSNLYVRMNKPDSAIYVLGRAVKLNPKMGIAYKTMGTIYRINKMKYDSAALNFLAALKLDSNNTDLLYNVAWCYNATQDYDKAIMYAVKALSRDVNFRPAYNEMGHAYHATKKYDEALEQFKKYAAISTCELPLFYSGLIYLELNQYDNVQKTIDELMLKGKKQQADGLKKRWDIKVKQKPPTGS